MPIVRGSWYSQFPPFGWFDPGDRPGSNALGVPDWQQGIATPGRKDLGKWFNVTPPGGGIPYPMQKTDVGPAKWTGRGVDISAAGAHQMGYTPKNFPTDASFKIEPRDEPRGLGSSAGLPVQAGDLPDNANPDAMASGPQQSAARKSMPTSLMDMFQPQDPAGQPVGFGDALSSRSNSLIGLGMGLLSPYRPSAGESPWVNALQGWQSGGQLDARIAQAAAARRQHAADRAQAQANANRSFNEQVRQFNVGAEGGKTPPGWARTPEGGLAPIPGGPADPKYLQATTEARRESTLPPGWARTPDGGMMPIPGGPADPKYLHETSEAKQKPREFSVTDISKLSEEGGKYAQVGRFTDTFEPRFAGYRSGVLGQAANLAGRNLPEGMVGEDIAKGAAWWQGYDRYKNVIRNELYGASLQPAEIKAFEQADITPGMDPKQIQKNLDTQKAVVQNGLKRKANAMIVSGYDPKAISQAYGIDLSELGITPSGRRDVAPVTPTPPASIGNIPAPPAGFQIVR